MNFLLVVLGLLGWLSGPVLTIVVLLYYPEKVEKWIGLLGKLVSKVWKGAGYWSEQYYVQGSVNDFIKGIESSTSLSLPRAKVNWKIKDREEDVIWNEGEVILVMKDGGHKQKNFVRAAYYFASKVLLKECKQHLSKSQSTSLDLFTTYKILESQSKYALEQFIQDYFQPELNRSTHVKDFIRQYKAIERRGIYFPVLIRELSFLGKKTFLFQNRDEVVKEVKDLLEFLVKFSQRDVGEKSPEDFIGKFSRCCIKIIASSKSIENDNLHAHIERIEEAFSNNLENIYIIGGAHRKCTLFIDKVVDAALNKCKGLTLNGKYRFKGTMKKQGVYRPVETYFVHLHHSEAVKYMFTEEDIELPPVQ